MSAPAYSYDFRIVGYPTRVYSGLDALEQLPAELGRHRARRAYVICGRSVSRKTALITRIRTLLGASFAGLYDEMGKDSPIADVIAARDGARAAAADLLIAVGGGSVIQATRIVAILLAEKEPIEKLMTQYPEGGAAISPRLMAPKLPIINVLTVGTSAQNRAGSPAKAEGLDHRMEFFDPKTRPVALFWDQDALLTAPVSMVCASGGAIFWRAIMNMGYTQATPLADFNRRQVYELSRASLDGLKDPRDVAARMNLCLATYLQNREVDDGGGPIRHWVSRVVYAFAAALFHLHEQVSQGAAHCAMTAAVMRRLGSRDPEAMCRIADALGVWRDGDKATDAPFRAADELERIFTSIGQPINLSQIDIPRSSAEPILAASMKNFNADPKREFIRERELLSDVLASTWH
jgi:alcohol dehydrogenase class IV